MKEDTTACGAAVAAYKSRPPPPLSLSQTLATTIGFPVAPTAFPLPCSAVGTLDRQSQGPAPSEARSFPPSSLHMHTDACARACTDTQTHQPVHASPPASPACPHPALAHNFPPSPLPPSSRRARAPACPPLLRRARGGGAPPRTSLYGRCLFQKHEY